MKSPSEVLQLAKEASLAKSLEIWKRDEMRDCGSCGGAIMFLDARSKLAKVAIAEGYAYNNTDDRDKQALAVVHRDAFIRRKAALSKAQREMTALKKTITEDGFTPKQIQIMADLQTPEGEAAVRLSITRTLEAARWASNPLGAQLDMFQEPDRTPSVDMAFEEGIQDAMSGKTAKPGYDPSVPQHASYMRGFHEETERRIKTGIKKTEPEKPRAETLAAARAANEVPSPPADKLN